MTTTATSVSVASAMASSTEPAGAATRELALDALGAGAGLGARSAGPGSPVGAPSLESLLRFSALAACAMVAALLALFAIRGIGQDPLQFVHAPAEYVALLLRDPAGLRAVLGIDNAFIMFYTTMYVVLALLLVRTEQRSEGRTENNSRGTSRALVIAAFAPLFAVSLLDMIENFHFMTMLAAAEHGLGVSADEIRLQVTESLLKFHVGYLGLFLLGFALPRDRRAGRLLAWGSYLQLPVGILIYVTPPSLSYPLVLVRTSYFVAALVGVALLFPPVRSRARAA
jgi:hypothetical protein